MGFLHCLHFYTVVFYTVVTIVYDAETLEFPVNYRVMRLGCMGNKAC